MSDRVSNGFVGWAVRASKIKWIFAFPLLLGGVAVCAALQTAAFVVALLLFSVVALYLCIGNFGFYSDKRIALRFAVGRELGSTLLAAAPSLTAASPTLK